MIAAHVYARLGWPVLPLEPRGKNPLSRLVRNGVKMATTDPAVLDEWHRKAPSANWGVACKSLLTVLDVDLRHGGEAELERLRKLHGPLPFTPWQRTGTGGHHFVFQHPGVAMRGKVGPGLDLLHGDKYFLVSPSIHPCGGRYTWTVEPWRVAAAPMPAWLLALARPVEVLASGVHRRQASTVTSSSQREARIARGRAYAARIEPAISGQNGHTATLVACAKLVNTVGLNAAEAFEALGEWNQRCQPPWTEAELRRKIDHAIRGNGAQRRSA